MYSTPAPAPDSHRKSQPQQGTNLKGLLETNDMRTQELFSRSTFWNTILKQSNKKPHQRALSFINLSRLGIVSRGMGVAGSPAVVSDQGSLLRVTGGFLAEL